MKLALSLSVCASLLVGCASQPLGLSLNELETENYLVTERRRLPVDFPTIQQNLFKHAKACGETYVFKMKPGESSYADVIYRPQPDAGWEHSVVLHLVLLQNRSTNLKAYSYYAGQMDRIQTMMTAIMKPEHCGIDHSWENRIDDED